VFGGHAGLGALKPSVRRRYAGMEDIAMRYETYERNSVRHTTTV
jgi:hypothetical protein